MIDPKYTRPTKNIWFPDQVEPEYDPTDEAVMEVFKTYWTEEKRRMKEGFYLADGKVYISGWLYWHTVYWNIAMYIENEKLGKKIRVIKTPYLRDIEWIIADDFTICEKIGKFYPLVGSRDFGKSIIAGSRAGYNYTLFDKSESIVSAGNATYIKLATDKVEDGLINLHPILAKQRIINDWKKEVKAGWKDKKTGITHPNSSQSSIQIRNFEEGSKTDAAVGSRPGFHLIDEIGTIKNFIACLKDSEGAWWSGITEGEFDKPSCLAMITGTGGDMEKGKEAAEVFIHPEAYNMLAFDNPEIPGTKMGRFIDALMAKMKYKEPKKLSEYLGIQHPDLERITILVTNREKAREWWDKEYTRALKSNNQKTLLKFKAFWPLVPSDSFLVLTKNDFNVTAAKAQKGRLAALGKIGTPVELYHDGEKICHKFTDKLPISEFPAKTLETLDAPVVIWEFPIDDEPPFGLYMAGVDPYRQGKAEYSDSLGAVYIFKRIHDIQSDRYQNLFVASYVARPESKDKWNETARLLIKYYNAYTLCENDEYSFIDYMLKKGDAARYLAPQPSWLREIVPNTSVRRDYGIHRSSDRIRNHLNGLLKSYLDDAIYKDEDTGQETLGVTRVFDSMLLEEIIHFNSEEGNYDRVVAAQLAIALADHLNPQFVVASDKKDPRFEAYFSGKKSSNKIIDFSISTPMISNRGRFRSKLFI
jgi:hypothetical protein